MIINSKSQLISIIMPVFNGQEYLSRAIDSVLDQSCEEWELIAIDDGSKDNSLHILRYYQSLSSKIKVLYQDHKNLPSARNKGIKYSTGSYITFLDCDDEITKDHLKYRLNFLKENPGVDFLHGGVKVIGNQFVPDKENPSRLIHLSDCIIGASFFGKRKVFIELNGFRDIRYSEDSEFLERVLSKYKVKKINSPTYIYYRNIPNSITNSMMRINCPA